MKKNKREKKEKSRRPSIHHLSFQIHHPPFVAEIPESINIKEIL